MSFEKPKVDYHTGDPEKQKAAAERAKAIQEGNLPQQQAAAEGAPEVKPYNPQEGDPKKLAEAREKLKKLYPEKKAA